MALTGRFKLLLAIAVAVGAYVAYTTPVEQAAAAASRSAVPRRAGELPAAGGRNVSSAGSEEAARLLASLSHRVTDGSAAASLFSKQSWFVAPPPPLPAPVVEAPPTSPTAPPLPFAVMGSYLRPGDAKVYFLTRGDRVFDVHVGDTIDGLYSVDAESGGQLQLTYRPLKIAQYLPLGGS
jgi:hypothetical protein